MKRLYLLILLFLVLAFPLFYLYITSPKPSESTSIFSKPFVAATVFPVYDIARNIAGNDIHVQLVLPAGASPHTFELTPITTRHLENANLIFALGHGIDDWVTQNTHTNIIVVDANIPLRETDEHEDEHSDEEDSHEHGPVDPHYWLSGENGKIIAQNIATALKSKYPQFASGIDARLTNYLAELQVAHETTHTIINEVGNKNIVTLHDAWYYFADAYGLTIVDTYTPSAGKDPLPQDLVRLQKTITEYGIQTFYTERQTSSATLQAFFDDNKLLVGELDELGGLEGTQSYIDLLLYNANVFASQP